MPIPETDDEKCRELQKIFFKQTKFRPAPSEAKMRKWEVQLVVEDSHEVYTACMSQLRELRQRERDRKTVD